nr:GNAT family N-acetyltransferase [candidate division Zixibacteria bacterium]
MIIKIKEAGRDKKPILERLLQLYFYDFSEIEGGDVDDQGLFHYTYLDIYWEETGRYPYLVYVDGRPAGFVLVRCHSYFDSPEKTHVMAEFFVMRKYRRRGVGSTMAFRIFDKFPGRWEIAETPHNYEAREFWRHVIGQYTGGRFEEVILENDRWRGPVQYFKKVE